MSLNRKFLFVVVSIVFLLNSCHETIEKPARFIEEEKMVDLLVDMSLAEGTRSMARRDNNEKNLHKLTVDQYYNLVFEKYDITREQYDSINDYYTHFPNKYEEIYKKVLNKLNMIDAHEREYKKKIDQKKEIERKNRPTKELRKDLPKR